MQDVLPVDETLGCHTAAPTSLSPRRLRFGHALVAVLLLDLVFGVAVHPGMGDPDFWWHLRTGQWIAHTHRVPVADLYSYTAAGKPWVAHEWGFELFLYGLYHAGGFLAIALAKALLLTATFALMLRLCWRRSGGNAVAAVAATGVAAALSMVHWTERPHLITYLLLAFWLDRLYAFREGDARALRWLPWTVALWVNVHAGYAIGGLVFTVFALAEAIDGRLPAITEPLRVWLAGATSRMHRGWSPSQVRILGRTAGLCLLAALLNPQGARLFLYPLQYRSGGGLTKYVAEWASPDFHQPLMSLVLAPVILLCVALPFFTRRKPGAGELSLVLIGLRLALQSVRHLPVFGLLAAPFLAAQISEFGFRISDGGDGESAPSWSRLGSDCRGPVGQSERCPEYTPAAPARQNSETSARNPPRHGRGSVLSAVDPSANPKSEIRNPKSADGLIAGLFVAAAVGIALALVPWRRPDTQWVDPKDYPMRAVAALQRLPGTRHLLNDYAWGGYVIWSAWPRQRVFIDGRADVYGPSFLEQYQDLQRLRPDWQSLLARYHVDTVLWRQEMPLSQALPLLPGWKQVFHGDGTVLFVRR